MVLDYFQIDGEKIVVMFDPYHNENLYEGHIREARLGFDAQKRTFDRSDLLESTSMVMSPIELLQPDYEVCLPDTDNKRGTHTASIRPGAQLALK